MRQKCYLFRYRDSLELRQSTKYLKKYDRNNYKLEIKRCLPDDKGEYIVRAANSYGEKDYAVFLTVECKYHIVLDSYCYFFFLLNNRISLSFMIDYMIIIFYLLHIYINVCVCDELPTCYFVTSLSRY
jgi:hypothetical protein